jgi:hypothetical protein
VPDLSDEGVVRVVPSVVGDNGGVDLAPQSSCRAVGGVVGFVAVGGADDQDVDVGRGGAGLAEEAGGPRSEELELGEAGDGGELLQDNLAGTEGDGDEFPERADGRVGVVGGDELRSTLAVEGQDAGVTGRACTPETGSPSALVARHGGQPRARLARKRYRTGRSCSPRGRGVY